MRRPGASPDAAGESSDAAASRLGPGATGQRRRYVPLLHRVAAMNALLLIVAVILTVLVLAPGRLSGPRLDAEGLVLLAGVLVAVLVNVLLVRRVTRPLGALTAMVRAIDPERPGQRMPGAAPTSEAGELALGFNEMIARLEAERREATGRVLAGQEAERLRIAQELHDQVGQELTAALLLLARVENHAEAALREQAHEAREAVRESLEDVRRIAIELRPEALDDLGLVSALAVLGERFAERSGLEVDQRISESLPQLSAEVELVIYRVAQEALTNVARHSGSARAEVTLSDRAGRVMLTVRDHGSGLPGATPAGSGVRGMRERTGLIGGALSIGAPSSGAGCEVRLEVPVARVQAPVSGGPR